MRVKTQLAVGLLLALVVGCADNHPPQTTEEAVVSPREVYHNPVDKEDYVAPGGWKTYQPATPRPDQPERKVKVVQVRLLTSEADMADRTVVSEVAAFLGDAERLADVAFEGTAKQFRVTVQFTCKPAGHEIKLVYQGDADQELLQTYYDSLVAARKLPVKGGDVSLQLELSISPQPARP